MKIGDRFDSIARVENIFKQYPTAMQLKIKRDRDGYVLQQMIDERSPHSFRSNNFYERNNGRGWECVRQYFIASDEEIYRFQRL